MKFSLVKGFNKVEDYERYIDDLIDIVNSIDINKKTLLTGRNADGKSFIRKLLKTVIANKYKKENNNKALILESSQELRTASNPSLGAMPTFAHDLEWLATSSNSLHILEQIINKKDKATFIIIDESEVGIDEELLKGISSWLNEELECTQCGILITTHSRVFVESDTICDDWINLEGLTKIEWLNIVSNELCINEFKEFSDKLFIVVRDRLNKKK